MTSLANIKVLAIDVDGVLTDGKIGLSTESASETKNFHVHDGLGISLWHKAGFSTVIISGRNAPCVDKRAIELDIMHVKQGSKNKVDDLDAVLQQLHCSPEETCFIGDDLADISIMQHVGYAIAVSNAALEVKNIADWITPHEGGNGAVRDAIEHIMKANHIWEDAISMLSKEYAQQ
jgi:YrbI family 3-deoxy-D-manno-octulosonate 8-phosphate phosphatase